MVGSADKLQLHSQQVPLYSHFKYATRQKS